MTSHPDAWIARRIFQPPIVWFCQRTGITQYALHRYLWWAAVLTIVFLDDHRSYLTTAMLIVFAIARTVGTALRPDEPLASNFPMRMVIWFVLILTIFDTRADDVGTLPANIAILIAEYALTIRTIPPRKRRDRRATSTSRLGS